MKNRSNFSKLTGTLFCAGIVAITGCSGGNINDTTFNSQRSDSGTALVAINIGKVGQLAKKSAIEMEKLIIEIKVKDSVAAIIKDTSALSGYGKTVITKTFPSLTAPEHFVLQAKAFDKTGKLIHSGSKEFSTIPADTVDVSLDLAAMYSMLRVAFNDIPDSVSKVRLKIAAIDTLDSAFTRSTRDTIVFHHDYIPADTIGTTYPVSLEASGSFYGNDTVLFAADTTILAKAGKDTSYKIVLKWVGPGVPKGAAAMTVIIGSIGTTTVNAGFGVMKVGIPVAGLVAYYPFNGNVKDESGNGNDGILYGGLLDVDRFGISNKAINLNGSSGYIGTKKVLFADNWQTTIRESDATLNTSTSSVPLNKWASIIEVFDSENDIRSLYLNGVLVESASWTGEALSFSMWVEYHGVFRVNGWQILIGQWQDDLPKEFRIGYNGYIGPDNDEMFFNGKVDDVRLYNRTLTASEIQALYNENGWTGN